MARTRERRSISRRPLDPARILAEVSDDSAGGTVLFVGTVRDKAGGRRVTALQYEVYREMAERKMREIEAEVERKWPVKKVSLVHRDGTLRVGDVSVVVAVSSEHRAEAFEACRYAIERIKSSLPLWKRETFSGGRKRWVEGRPIEP